MTKFIQTGQHVEGNQYNAETINFGAVKDRSDAVSELRKLSAEVKRAASSGNIPTAVSDEINAKLEEAIRQAESPTPDKNTIINRLSGVQKLLEGIHTASSLIISLPQAISMIGRLFS
jgi:hypothetical protein